MSEQSKRTRKMVFLALLAAAAIILGYFEALLPLPTPVPYIKLGLGNVIIVTIMYVYGVRDAFLVAFIKILASCLLFSGAGALPYSLAGGILSVSVMALIKKSRLFGVVGVSVGGGASHMLGQILVASAIIENISLTFFLGPLLAAGAATGLFVGTISGLIIKRLQKGDTGF